MGNTEEQEDKQESEPGKSDSKVVIIGAGPAGLFSAALLLEAGYSVDLYDHSSGPGKKFLIAGNGGLNLTHSEDLESFSKRYGENQQLFKELLDDFSPDDLRAWLEKLGTKTFVGTSGRVFPVEMSAGKILLAWLNHLKSFPNFNLFLKHKFKAVTHDKTLLIENEQQRLQVKYSHVIFATGGGSWKKTGSDGRWVESFKEINLSIAPLMPMNCGFIHQWSDYFIKNVGRTYLKNVEIKVTREKAGKQEAHGDIMLTPYGIEGGAIYALSNFIRDNITKDGESTLFIDLRPALELKDITERLENRRKKTSISNFLRKSLKLPKEAFILIKELAPSHDLNGLNYLNDPKTLAKLIKELPLTVSATTPLDEAISTAGGVKFDQLTSFLELKGHPGIYFAGEMLDYEAPTGGYLLQACFSSSYRVVQGILKK